MLTWTTLAVPTLPLVSPRSVICSWSPAFTNWLLKSPHVLTSVAAGFEQLPTSVVRGDVAGDAACSRRSCRREA